jgi:hypothetical protein
MAKKNKAAVAAGAVEAARSNPYVQRVIEDDDLQDNVRVAFDAARDAYDRLASSKSAKKAIQNDKKLHKDLQVAAEALKEAGASLSSPKKKSKKRKGGLGRKLLILGVAGGLAIALSADLRSKVLDALFGAEEEFDYTSTTTPSAAPTTGATA